MTVDRGNAKSLAETGESTLEAGVGQRCALFRHKKHFRECGIAEGFPDGGIFTELNRHGWVEGYISGFVKLGVPDMQERRGGIQ